MKDYLSIMDCRRVLFLLRSEEISISKAVEILNDKIQEKINKRHEALKELAMSSKPDPQKLTPKNKENETKEIN